MKLTKRQGYKLSGAVAIALMLSSQASHSTPFSLEGTVWDLAGKSVGLDPELIYAVAMAESKKRVGTASVSPWPWALNIAGKGSYYATLDEARAALDEALSLGIKSIDVGPMQINLRWNGHRVQNPADLFDLATSARVGAEILSEAIASNPTDLVIGVGRYHNWDDALARPYGTKVLKFRNVIVQAGTPQ